MTLKQKMINQNKLEQYEIVKKFYEDYFLNLNPIDTFIEFYFYEKEWIQNHNIKFDIMEMVLELLQDFDFYNKKISNLVDDSNISITDSLYVLEWIFCARKNTIYVYTFTILYLNKHYFKRNNLEFSKEEQELIVDLFLNYFRAQKQELIICYEIAKKVVLNNSNINKEIEQWKLFNQHILKNGYIDEEELNKYDDIKFEDNDYFTNQIFEDENIIHNDDMGYDIEKICKENYFVSETKQNEKFWEYLINEDWSELDILSTFDFLKFLKK